MTRVIAIIAVCLSSCLAASAQVPFGPPIDVVGIAVTPFEVVAADFDGDGDMDILAGVQVVINDGAGNLTPGPVIFAGVSPTNVTVGDFNDDGFPDALVIDNGASTVSIFTNDGLGNFSLSGSMGTGIDPSDVVVGHFDTDGRIDFAVSGRTAGVVTVYFNTAAGINTINIPIGPAPGGLVALDIDDDGLDDLAATNQTNNLISWVLNLGAGVFGAPSFLPTGGMTPVGIDTGDFNTDGLPDLAVLTFGSGTLEIWENDGAGGFTPGVPIATIGANPLSLYVGDLDHRLGMDVMVAYAGQPALRPYYNQGLAALVGAGTEPGLAFTSSVIGVDLDGDDNIDLVSCTPTGGVKLRVHMSLAPANPFPGTGDDIQVSTGVDAAPSVGAGEFIKDATPGQVLLIGVESPSGGLDFTPLLLVAQVFWNGFPPPAAIGGLWLNTFGFGAVILVNGFDPSSPLQHIVVPGGSSYGFTVIPEVTGFSVMIQAIIASNLATNGFLAASDGCVIRVQ